MPLIELILPGNHRTTVIPFAETYRITVERNDGIACSEVEAATAMSTLCVHGKIEEMKANKNERKKPLVPKPPKEIQPSEP